MQDDNCRADISSRFGEFCSTNGRIIAQRIVKFLATRILFGSALDNAGEGVGPWGGGTVADMGICKACLPSRVANLMFDGCGTQFRAGTIHI